MTFTWHLYLLSKLWYRYYWPTLYHLQYVLVFQYEITFSNPKSWQSWKQARRCWCKYWIYQRCSDLYKGMLSDNWDSLKHIEFKLLIAWICHCKLSFKSCLLVWKMTVTDCISFHLLESFVKCYNGIILQGQKRYYEHLT